MCLTSGCGSPDLKYSERRQLFGTPTTPAAGAALTVHVGDVFGLCANEQVIRADTCWVVAGVEKHPCRPFSR